MRHFFYFVTLAILLLSLGCAQSFILLSPDDLYALGNNYMDSENFRDAAEQFERIRRDYPTSEYATMSQFKLALAEYERGRYDDAAVEFQLFREFHPAHKMAPQAQYYLAMSKFNSLKSPERDTTVAQEAYVNLTQFLVQYPTHPDFELVNQYLIQVIDHLQTHELEVAKVYYRRRSLKAAINRLVPILETKASTGLKQEVALLLAKAYEKNNEPENARKYYELTIENGNDPELVDDARQGLKRNTL